MGLSMTRRGQWLVSMDAITLETARRDSCTPEDAGPSLAHCSATETRGVRDTVGDCQHCLRHFPEERQKVWNSGGDGFNAVDRTGKPGVLSTDVYAPHTLGSGEMVTKASFLCTTKGRAEV